MFKKVMKVKNISVLALLAVVAFTFSVSVARAVEGEVVLQAETTLSLCTDGIDNDNSGASDGADVSCAEVLAESNEPELVSEDTAELCSDGIDNDNSGASDMADISCTEFGEDEKPVLVAEDTAELCSDGIDNDNSGASDAADISCAPFLNPDNEGENGGNNGGSNDDEDKSSSRRSSGQKKSSNRPAPQGEVLGAFTGSCPFLTTYMRIGRDNDVAEVKKLQEFLNAELNISLPVTGFFGQMTHDAVNAFQLKYKDSVLAPWVEAGLHASEGEPTGYVYLTTRYMINKIVCPDEDIAEPVLPKTL